MYTLYYINSEFRQADPKVELFVNDYHLTSADMGQCLLDIVNGYDFDYIGIQVSLSLLIK